LEKKLFVVAQIAVLNSSSERLLTCTTVLKPRELAEAVKQPAKRPLQSA